MRTYTDKALKNMAVLIAEVVKENKYQIAKWGIQKRIPFEWMGYLTEEVGELAQAISEHHYREGKREQVVHEAIQVATLALKIAEMYGEDDGER